jgi:hypothetical protein
VRDEGRSRGASSFLPFKGEAVWVCLLVVFEGVVVAGVRLGWVVHFGDAVKKNRARFKRAGILSGRARRCRRKGKRE